MHASVTNSDVSDNQSPTSRNGSRYGSRYGWMLATLVVLVSLAGVAVSFSWPMAYNHAIYLQSAQIALTGADAASGLMDTKGPMSYAPLMPALALLRDGLIALRVVDLLFVMIGGFGMWHLLRATASRAAATIAACSLVSLVYSFGFRRTAEPDEWMALCTLALVGLCVRYRETATRSFGPIMLGAALLGVVGLYLKPFYVLTAFLPALLVHDFRTLVRTVLVQSLVVGLLAALGVGLLHVTGLLPGYLDVQFGFNLSSYSSVDKLTPFDRVQNVLTVLISRMPISPGVWVPWLAYSLLITRPRELATDRLLIGWLLVGGFYMLLQGRVIEYQAFAFIIPAAALCAVGVTRMPSIAAVPGRPAVRSVVASMLVVTAVFEPLREAAIFVKSNLDGESRSEYWDRFVYLRTYSPGDDARASTLIHDIAPANSRVEVWGQNTALMYLSGHRTPTGFVAWIMLTGKDSERLARYRQQYLRTIDSAPPSVIVTAEEDPSKPPASHAVKFFPALATRIQEQYLLCARHGHLSIFRHRALPANAHCQPSNSATTTSVGVSDVQPR